jgi:hypothetical protein
LLVQDNRSFINPKRYDRKAKRITRIIDAMYKNMYNESAMAPGEKGKSIC